ncbi:MAG: methyltransferase domain-containing protein [Bdellovibrionales bacterium]|nr:methyltransferase domain-containing protein [Bdellovibrionales bacterium]
MKHDVKARFSKAARSYEKHADVQQRVADRLVSLFQLDPPPTRILDVGCGTGILTSRLVDRFPDAEIVAVDISDEMIDQAQLRSFADKVEWVVSDVLKFDDRQRFDLVTSSSTIQWVLPHSELFEHLYNLISPGGRLFFSMMVTGTLTELHSLRRTLFPEKLPATELSEMSVVKRTLEQAGFSVLWRKTMREDARYEDALAFFRSLHELGITGGHLSNSGVLLNRRELTRLIAEYQKRYGLDKGEVRASYQIGYFHCSKQNPSS